MGSKGYQQICPRLTDFYLPTLAKGVRHGAARGKKEKYLEFHFLVNCCKKHLKFGMIIAQFNT